MSGKCQGSDSDRQVEAEKMETFGYLGHARGGAHMPRQSVHARIHRQHTTSTHWSGTQVLLVSTHSQAVKWNGELIQTCLQLQWMAEKFKP